MKVQHIIASVAIHAAIIGPMVASYHLHPPSNHDQEQPIPVFFETVEEALPPLSDEQPGTVPEDVGAVPEYDMEPDQPGTVPEDVGTVPEYDMGPVSEEVRDERPARSQSRGTRDPAKQAEGFATVSDANAEETAQTNESQEQAKVVSDPVALNRIIPVYPRSARRRGHEGCVTVEILVEEDGHVSEAGIVSSSGHAELDSAALGVVRTARFAPATDNGVAVRGRLRLPFCFKLE